MQTQQEFVQFYLAPPVEASKFPRSGVVHQVDDEDSNAAKAQDSSDIADYDSLDWRDKGCVTSVSHNRISGTVILYTQ